MAKGVLMYSATEVVMSEKDDGGVGPGTNLATFSLAVSREMAPRFTLVVFLLDTFTRSSSQALVDTIHVPVSLVHTMKVSDWGVR